MAKQSLTTIKNWFKSTFKPTQTQFWDTWDSFFHKDEKIPSASVEGLDETLTSKASTELVNYLRAEVENFAGDMAAKLDRGGYTGSAQDLSNAIQNVLAVLASDDTTLDELQEIVNYIKQNKQVLESLGISNIAGLQDALNGKVDKVAGKQLTTEDFTTLLKLKLDAIDMTAKLDRGGYTGTAKDLSNAIQNILAVLASDDTTLDQLQEIVNYIKQNKQVLETLGISNIAGLQDALNKTVTTEDTLTDSYLLAGGGDKTAKKTSAKIDASGRIAGVNGIILPDLSFITGYAGSNNIPFANAFKGLNFVVNDNGVMKVIGLTPQGGINVPGTVQTKNIAVSANAGLGKIINSDALGNASWKGAEIIALTGNEIDMSAGDVFTKTLTIDTTITITNPIVGKSVLFVVTGGGYGLTLPGTNLSEKAYSKTDVNRIRITCESSGSLIYEILSVKDTYISVERGGTIDVSAGTHFMLNTGGTGANEYTIANINYNKTIYLYCYNSVTDLVLITSGVRRNIGNVPGVGLKQVGITELAIALRGEQIRILSPEISLPYQVDNTINFIFTNGANGTNGNYCGVFAESDYEMSVDYSNSGGRVKCGNNIYRRFSKYLDQTGLKLYTQGVRTIAFKDDYGNSLGIGLSELQLNTQWELEILDLDGVGEHLYAFNSQNSVIDLSTYSNLQYFRMSSSCFINSIVLTNCMKIRRLFVSNQNVTSVVFPALHEPNYDFKAEISANLSSTVVNAMLAAIRLWPAPEAYSDFEKTVILGVGTAAPTGQGLTDKAALIAAGWNVVTN